VLKNCLCVEGIHTLKSTLRDRITWGLHRPITHLRVYVCVCLYVCMYACIYACMYVCMHVCMFVYVCVRMHVCICVYALQICFKKEKLANHFYLLTPIIIIIIIITV